MNDQYLRRVFEMNGWNLVGVNETDKAMDFAFQGCDPNAVAQAVDQYFLGSGYRLEGGGPGNATYGIGSDIMRILFGALARRYKFYVLVSSNGPQTTLRVEKAISGAMGGLIGHSAMKKECRRIFGELRGVFQPQPTGQV